MRFDLTDLRLFCDVADAGSITAGAERSALALAAASTRIRGMEQALGAPLLIRSRQGTTPTEAGRTLLKHARVLLDQSARLREDLSAYAGGLSGEVRLLANTNALTEFLPEALSAFLAAHPHVSVDLEERLSDEIVGLVAEGGGHVVAGAGAHHADITRRWPKLIGQVVVVGNLGHVGIAGQGGRVAIVDVLEESMVDLDHGDRCAVLVARQAMGDDLVGGVVAILEAAPSATGWRRHAQWLRRIRFSRNGVLNIVPSVPDSGI